MTEVLTCGEAILLMLASPGVPLSRAHSFQRSVAGAEANVAIGLSRLGHSVHWLSRVGADSAGDAVLEMVRAAGVDTSEVRVDDSAPTGLLLRDSHPAGPIDVQYYRAGSAASGISPDDVLVQSGTRLVHIIGIPRCCPRRHAKPPNDSSRSAAKLGSPEPWRDTVGPLRCPRRSSSSEPASTMSVRARCRTFGSKEIVALTEHRPAHIVVKNPDKSATVGGRRQECFSVPAADPVGAGDAFAASFLSAWLRGLSTERALTEAAAVAAFAVQSATDIDGLPTAAEHDRWLAAAGDVHR
jgi:2-dehydro-3-deoxygluconokinase